MGLETARRGMFTQQSALHTTGHNISNANTPGYTRQRINFAQTEPYPGASLNRPQIPGQFGTGVKAESVQRIREGFLDIQYRGENNKLGYWETRAESYKKMEEIMNEPSDSGLAQSMDMFWQALQDLAVNPSNPGARSVVRQRGVAVAETFNYLSSSLTAIKQDIKNETLVTEKEINSLAEQINKINGQIADVEPHGYLPNDLYDERDRLIDQLSSLVNIKVDYRPSGGNSSAIAEGKAFISIMSEAGAPLGILVGAGGSNTLEVKYDGLDGSVNEIKLGTGSIDINAFDSKGKLKALIESHGYQTVDASNNKIVKGIYSSMLTELDNMAYTFATEFNKVHENGLSPNEIKNGDLDISFFADIRTNPPAPVAPKADIVFVVDNTGSMSSIQQEVANNISDFVNVLSSKGINDYRIGVVSYYDSTINEVDFSGSQWTTDATAVKNALSALTNAGGTENLMGTVDQVIQNYSFRPNEGGANFKHVVFVTNEGIDDKALQTDIMQKLQQNGIQTHGVVDASHSDINELNNLISSTNGSSINLNDTSWGSKLTSIIGNKIGNAASVGASIPGEKKGFAGRIQVSAEIMNSLDNIAHTTMPASGNPSDATLGDASNILALADVINKPFNYGNDMNSNFRNYYEVIVGGMAVDSQESVRLSGNSGALRQAVEERRMSVSSVSLDEEMTNMIQFQHAYNASARMITLQDEMLDKIINGMGTVGR